MATAADDIIPLNVLSDRQRATVESHLRLVQHTLNRNRHLVRQRRDGRESHELFQEGCLALIEAVRNYDASRHGHFAPYAMARIHFALSRYVHENDASVRVPFITQRRRRAKAAPPGADARSGAPLPIVQRLGDASAPPARFAEDDEFPNQPRIGDLIADRVERAMTRVIDDMKRAPRCNPTTPEVIERCAQERWRIPEPDARMSIRRLAKALDCSVGRITHCEERFRQRMGKALGGDPTYQALREEARRGERGFDERLPPERLAKLRPAPNAEPSPLDKALRSTHRRPRQATKTTERRTPRKSECDR
ncbi:MAG: hypothetical protein KDA33_03830 [Phycisphaerales bacterium]|nr:hypothetical protein [Phycisphaerales bacterium]